ncbi:MAG: MBL fold metallo-hydrolase [Patescibacteria group bacterium]
MEFVPLGGALDPMGQKPPIGGSAYALRDRKSSTMICVDFGAYQMPVEEQLRRAEEIMLIPDEPEFLDIGAGMRLPPTMPRLNNVISRPDENIFFEGYLPDMALFEECERTVVIVTHGHADHLGALPYLRRRFPRTTIYMTRATYQLGEWSWKDAIKVARREGRQCLFDEFDVDALRRHVKIIKPGDRLEVGPFEIEIHHAGHIVGAISVLVTKPSRVFFSGDICFHDQHTVGGATLPQLPVDFVVSEATYAGRIARSREELEGEFVQAIVECLEAGGKVLCPVLAIARSAEVWWILKKHGVVGQYPVLIDGAARHTGEVYITHGAAPPEMRNYFISSPSDRRRITSGTHPLVAIAPSGMLSGGHAVQYAAALAGKRENLIALTSYQDPCSPGGMLLRVRRGETVTFCGKRVQLSAAMQNFTLSAHMDAHGLGQMIEQLQPRETFLTHGSEENMDAAIAQHGGGVTKALLGAEYQI